MDQGTTSVCVGTTIDGDLRGDEDVRIEGRVNGSIDIAGTVLIERTGVVRGDVRGRRVIVAGICIGSIEAADEVVVRGSARVVGDVSAPTLEVDPAATFHSRTPTDARAPDGEPERGVLSAGNGAPSRPGLRRAPPPSLPRLERAVARRRSAP